MSYDILGGSSCERSDKGFSFKDILEVLNKHPNDTQVVFIRTEYTIGEIISWRGDYSTPAIIYTDTYRTALDCSFQIRSDLEKVHEGYKGGEYEYDFSDTPYLVKSSPSVGDYHQIVGFEYDKVNNLLSLATKIVPYQENPYE